MSTHVTETPSTIATTAQSADFQDVIDRFVAAAMSIDPGEVKPCRANTDVMPGNVNLALASINEPDTKRKIAAAFTDERVEQYDDLAAMAHVLAHLAREAQFTPESADSLKVRDAFATATELRRTMEPLVELAVAEKLIPEVKAAAMPRCRGRSPVSLGNRVVDLALLLKNHASQLEGKVLVAGELLSQAVEVGTVLRDSGAAKLMKYGEKQAPSQQAEQRDRVFTLLSQRYDRVRRLGGYLFGEQRDEFVPPLTSARKSRHGAEAMGTDQGQVAPEKATEGIPAVPANSDKPAPAPANGVAK